MFPPYLLPKVTAAIAHLPTKVTVVIAYLPAKDPLTDLALLSPMGTLRAHLVSVSYHDLLHLHFFSRLTLPPNRRGRGRGRWRASRQVVLLHYIILVKLNNPSSSLLGHGIGVDAAVGAKVGLHRRAPLLGEPF